MHSISYTRTRSLYMIDIDVCMHDPYSCKQLQHLERLIFNIFNTINIGTRGGAVG
jgi:hypothetical protein